ncbi:Tripartite tricarboxylate transporter family receptor [compost metagenome]
MTKSCKTVLAALGLASAIIAPAPAGAGGALPKGPVRVVVPYPAGGNADNLARLFAERMTRDTGITFVVENRGGAGGSIGAQSVAAAAGDGTTLLLAPTGVHVITPHLRQVPYDPVKDFVPIAKLTSTIGIVAARRDLPARDMRDFIAYAKDSRNKTSYGSAGLGTLTHLQGEVVSIKTGVKMLHVPYKGSAEALNDLLAGRIDVLYDPVALQQIKAGKLKALASTGAERHPDLPDVPTLRELKLDYSLPSWYGLYAPKGTPPAVVSQYAAATERVLKAPEVKAQLMKFSQYPTFEGPAEFSRQLSADDAFYRQLIKDGKIRLE